MKNTVNIHHPTHPGQLPLLCAALLIAVPFSGFAQAPPIPEEAAVTDYRPEKYNPGRYRSIYANSAFEREILPPVIETKVEEPTPFEFKIVSVTGRDGRYRVVLIDKKGKYQVVTETPDADGFHYSNIEPAANIQEFRVQVSKGSQTEWVEFDSKRFSIASKNVAPPKPTNRSARPAVVPNVRKPVPTRAPFPVGSGSKTAGEQAGAKSQAAIQQATESAVRASQERSGSRVSGRRVVLPPKSR